MKKISPWIASQCHGGRIELIDPQTPPQLIGHTEKYGISIYAKDYLITNDDTGETVTVALTFGMCDKNSRYSFAELESQASRGSIISGLKGFFTALTITGLVVIGAKFAEANQRRY